MSNNAKGNVESLQKTRNKLTSFKNKVAAQCDNLQQAASSTASFCKYEQSRRALDKLNKAIEEIRDALDIVQPVLEKIRKIEQDIDDANQIQM